MTVIHIHARVPDIRLRARSLGIDTWRTEPLMTLEPDVINLERTRPALPAARMLVNALESADPEEALELWEEIGRKLKADDDDVPPPKS